MPAFPVAADTRQEGLHAVDNPDEIDADAEVPIVVGSAIQGTFQTDTGVVDDDVHFAEMALRLIGGSRHGCAIGNVEATHAPMPPAAGC